MKVVSSPQELGEVPCALEGFQGKPSPGLEMEVVVTPSHVNITKVHGDINIDNYFLQGIFDFLCGYGHINLTTMYLKADVGRDS